VEVYGYGADKTMEGPPVVQTSSSAATPAIIEWWQDDTTSNSTSTNSNTIMQQQPPNEPLQQPQVQQDPATPNDFSALHAVSGPDAQLPALPPPQQVDEAAAAAGQPMERLPSLELRQETIIPNREEITRAKEQSREAAQLRVLPPPSPLPS
jgi:DNA segregation ATPase FtsK/SpoIIIE-like protein